jgi:outer membrane protein TolC
MKFFLLTFINVLFTWFLQAQPHNLDYYLNQAINNSPLIKEYQNRILSNQIDSMRIRAGLGSQISLVSTNSYAPVVKGWGYDEAITNGANITGLVSYSKEIVGKNNRQNQYQSVNWQNLSIANAKKISEQELKKTVSDQYILTYGLWQLNNYYNDVLDLLKKEEPILKKLTEQNTYKQTEYLSFIVTVQQQELQVLQSKNDYQNNFYGLNYLCGIVDTAIYLLMEPDVKLAILPLPEQSVFFQQFVFDSLKLAINDKQIDFEYKPKLSLFADAGYVSSLAYQPGKNFGASAGLSLRMPIYDGGQRKMQHDKISIADQVRKDYRDFYNNQYQQQIRQLLKQLEGNQQIADQLLKQIQYSQILVKANHQLLETGEARLSEMILAINNYIMVNSLSVQNTIEKYRIINQINYWGKSK